MHRAGIKCGCDKCQIARHNLESQFVDLIGLMTVNQEMLDTMLRLAGETSQTFGGDEEMEKRRTAAIAKSQRKLDAAHHLYDDGDITREEYLRRKEVNEGEIAQWNTYTSETQKLVAEVMICLDALGKLRQLWEGSTYEDRNRMAHNLFDHLIFDLDMRRIVDFKLKLGQISLSGCALPRWRMKRSMVNVTPEGCGTAFTTRRM